MQYHFHFLSFSFIFSWGGVYNNNVVCWGGGVLIFQYWFPLASGVGEKEAQNQSGLGKIRFPDHHVFFSTMVTPLWCHLRAGTNRTCPYKNLKDGKKHKEEK